VVGPVDQQQDIDAAISHVYGGQCLDDVMKLEIPWLNKCLNGKE